MERARVQKDQTEEGSMQSNFRNLQHRVAEQCAKLATQSIQLEEQSRCLKKMEKILQNLKATLLKDQPKKLQPVGDPTSPTVEPQPLPPTQAEDDELSFGDGESERKREELLQMEHWYE